VRIGYICIFRQIITEKQRINGKDQHRTRFNDSLTLDILLFVLLSDTVFLSVVVILLLVEMSCFCVHIANGSLMISSVAINVSLNNEFLHNFYSRKVVNVRTELYIYCHMLRPVVLNFYFIF